MIKKINKLNFYEGSWSLWKIRWKDMGKLEKDGGEWGIGGRRKGTGTGTGKIREGRSKKD